MSKFASKIFSTQENEISLFHDLFDGKFVQGLLVASLNGRSFVLE
jgi:hypothetical protein